MSGIERNTGYYIGAVVTVNVVTGIAENGGCIGSAGLKNHDARRFPAFDEIVGRGIPGPPHLVAEGKVVNVGEREALPEVEIRPAFFCGAVVGIFRKGVARVRPEICGIRIKGFRPSVSPDYGQAVRIVVLDLDLKRMVDRGAYRVGIRHGLEIRVRTRAGRAGGRAPDAG